MNRATIINTILASYGGASAINSINDVLASIGQDETSHTELRALGFVRNPFDCYAPIARISDGARDSRGLALEALTQRGFDFWRANRPAIWRRWMREDSRMAA
jgi:hypothetical protein